MEIVFDLSRLLAGGYLVWSGAAKLGDVRRFWKQVMGYQLVSPLLARIISSSLPPIELVLGLLFAAGYYPILTGPALIVLVAAFTFAITQSLIRNLDNECGCGPTNQKVRPALVFRNLGIIALLVAGLFSAGQVYAAPLIVAAAGLLCILGISAARYRLLNR